MRNWLARPDKRKGLARMLELAGGKVNGCGPLLELWEESLLARSSQHESDSGEEERMHGKVVHTVQK